MHYLPMQNSKNSSILGPKNPARARKVGRGRRGREGQGEVQLCPRLVRHARGGYGAGDRVLLRVRAQGFWVDYGADYGDLGIGR